MKSSENSFRDFQRMHFMLDRTRKPLFPQLETKNFFLSENVACQKIILMKNLTMPKIIKGGPFGILKIHFVAKLKENFWEKTKLGVLNSVPVTKIIKGGTLWDF